MKISIVIAVVFLTSVFSQLIYAGEDYTKNPTVRWLDVPDSEAMKVEFIEGKPTRPYSIVAPLIEQDKSGALACMKIRKQARYYNADAIIDLKYAATVGDNSWSAANMKTKDGARDGSMYKSSQTEQTINCSGLAVKWKIVEAPMQQ